MRRANKIALYCAATLIVYFSLALTAFVFSFNGPTLAGRFAYWFIVPSLFMLDLVTPVLKQLELAGGGGFISFPEEAGIVLAILIYAIGTYCFSFTVASWALEFKNRDRR